MDKRLQIKVFYDESQQVRSYFHRGTGNINVLQSDGADGRKFRWNIQSQPGNNSVLLRWWRQLGSIKTFQWFCCDRNDSLCSWGTRNWLQMNKSRWMLSLLWNSSWRFLWRYTSSSFYSFPQLWNSGFWHSITVWIRLTKFHLVHFHSECGHLLPWFQWLDSHVNLYSVVSWIKVSACFRVNSHHFSMRTETEEKTNQRT